MKTQDALQKEAWDRYPENSKQGYAIRTAFIEGYNCGVGDMKVPIKDPVDNDSTLNVAGVELRDVLEKLVKEVESLIEWEAIATKRNINTKRAKALLKKYASQPLQP